MSYIGSIDSEMRKDTEKLLWECIEAVSLATRITHGLQMTTFN